MNRKILTPFLLPVFLLIYYSAGLDCPITYEINEWGTYTVCAVHHPPGEKCSWQWERCEYTEQFEELEEALKFMTHENLAPDRVKGLYEMREVNITNQVIKTIHVEKTPITENRWCLERPCPKIEKEETQDITCQPDELCWRDHE